MNKIFLLFAALLLCIGKANELSAQAMPSAKIASIKAEEARVVFAVSAAEPFYAGDNIFTLYIGQQSYNLYQEEVVDGKGLISFLIPKNEFDALEKAGKVYIGYGDKPADESLASLCQSLPNMYKYLGTFQPELFLK